MRRLAALVVTLALAAPAGAQSPSKGRITVVQPPVKAAPLRGMQAPSEAPAEAALAAAPAMTPLPTTRSLATQAQAGDAAQCRLTCARNYYFCLTADDAEICGPDWGQCRAACGRAAGAGGAP